MTVRNWGVIIGQLSVMFPERIKLKEPFQAQKMKLINRLKYAIYTTVLTDPKVFLTIK